MNRIILAVIAAISFCQAGFADTNWLTDLPKARTQAKAENKLVLMDFTGSDWCAGCIMFNNQVLASKEFQAYAASNVVVVEVDFPEKKEQPADLKKANNALMEKFNIEAYPTLVILDSGGKEIARQTGYDGNGPKEFIAALEKFKSKNK